MDGGNVSVWKICANKRVTYLVTTTIAVLIAIVFNISLPNTFVSQEVLIVESSAPMNLLVGADMYAKELMKKKHTSPVANNSFAYKNVFHSNIMINSIKNKEVKETGGKTVTMEQHLRENYKGAWWEPLFGDKNTDDIIRDRLRFEIKLKPVIIIVQYEDEDGNVSSQVTNALTSMLNDYFKDLNMQRIQPDLEYYKKRRQELGITYKESARKYSDYYDSHLGAELQSEQSQLEFLRNDMNTKYEEYSKASIMYKRAEMYTQQLQSVSTRIKTSQTFTSKNTMTWVASIAVAIFLAVVITSWYVLLKAKYGNNR